MLHRFWYSLGIRRRLQRRIGASDDPQVIVTDAAVMALRGEGLRPVAARYLSEISPRFPNARAVNDKLQGR